MSWVVTLGLALAALVGAPLFTVLGFTTLLGFTRNGVDSASVAIEMYRLAEAPMLIAIPLFTFAGYLLSQSGAPGRLVSTSRALFGWMPGGLALVGLVACAAFTALTGASGVTIIALGGLLLPALISERYPERFTYGLLTTSGSLGLLFPPSLPIILLAYVAAVSVDQLFVAGLLPGLLLMLVLGAYASHIARRHGVARQRFDAGVLRHALRGAIWEIPLPFVVLGGIYTGFFTITEAASITAMYVLVVEVFIYRDVKIVELPRILRDAMVLVGGILIILAAALGLTNYIIDADVPTAIFNWMQSFTDSKLVFLILLNVFLLIVGCLMDIFSAILVVVPLILPVAQAYGVDPLHLGIIFLTNLEIGYSTPPVGLNLFIASLRFDRSVLQLYRASVPFLGLYVLALLLITYWPQLSLWLVQALSVR